MTKRLTGEALAHQLAGDLRILIGKLRRHMRATRPGDLSTSQILTLRSLHTRGALTVTELAKEHGMRPQSMGAIITSLAEAQLVQREQDPSDGRQSILSLTPAARTLIERSRSARDDFLYDAIREELTSAEQRELLRAVTLLGRLADK